MVDDTDRVPLCRAETRTCTLNWTFASLNSIAPWPEHQPAEHPDHEQVHETDKHERRG
jgi:hypothetical protein